MLPHLVLAVLLAQDSSSDAVPTEAPYFERIERALATYCADSADDRKAAQTAGEVDPQHAIPFWSTYVKHVLRCAEQQHGINQARLYAAAIDGILNSILYLKPDADEAAQWRKRAYALIAKALKEAHTDPELVTLIERWQDELP
jgi:hypothetical protein